MHRYATIGDIVYFHFAANDTSGSGADGATPAYSVRLCGASSSAAPVDTGTPTLLSHASFPNGAHEIALDSSTTDYADGSTYAVFCTLAVSGQNPSGFVGQVTFGTVPADMREIGGSAQSATDLKDFADTGYDPSAHLAAVDVIRNGGTAITHTAGVQRVLLADSASHGGSTFVLTGSRFVLASATTNEPAVKLTGNGSAAGLALIGGSTGPALSATNTTGDVVTVTAVAGSGSALVLTGQGSGHAFKLVAGATGNAMNAAGGATSGSAVKFTGTAGNANAFEVIGQGTGNGALFQSGSGLTGSGIIAVANSTDGHGMSLGGTGSGSGLRMVAGNSAGASGALFYGGSGSGAAAVFSNTTGDVISVIASAGNGNAMRLAGSGSGAALALVAGSTGNGLKVTTTAGDGVSITPTGGNAVTLTANGTSKHGIAITGGTAGTSHGVSITAGSGGKGVNLDTFTATGALTVDSATITNALTVGSITNNGTLTQTGATTFTGAITATNASNDIRGVSLSLAGLQAFATTNAGLSTTDIDAGSVVHLITDNVGGGSAPTAGEIADAVWDESITDHLGAGSTGAALNAAGSAGDPWATPLPGAYGSGTAGKIIGDNINATISSRSSHAAADVWGVTTRLLTAGTNIVLAKGTGVTGFNDIAATAIVSGGAITTSGGAVSTVTNVTNLHASAALEATSQSIKAKTDNLPSDPADASDIAAAFSTVSGALATISAKTANLPTDPADQSAVETAITAAQTALTTLLNAVKAKTDSMTFTVAGYQDVNVRYVNSVGVAGSGVPGTDPWRPA